MTNYWVLQGNLKKWDHPDRFYSEPITGWSVPMIDDKISLGDGVLIWMAHEKPSLRGIYAAGKIAGEARLGLPLDWGNDKTRTTQIPFAPLAIRWYLMHNPVSVDDLAGSDFDSNLIMSMPRRTAYPCTETEFDAAIELMQAHGPTSLPIQPAPGIDDWWRAI